MNKQEALLGAWNKLKLGCHRNYLKRDMNRGTRSRDSGTAGKDGGGHRKKPSSADAVVDVWSKEEEYRKLNAELEAKTAGLVQEAEALLRGQGTKSSLLEKVDSDVMSYDGEQTSEDDYDVQHEGERFKKLSNEDFDDGVSYDYKSISSTGRATYNETKSNSGAQRTLKSEREEFRARKKSQSENLNGLDLPCDFNRLDMADRNRNMKTLNTGVKPTILTSKQLSNRINIISKEPTPRAGSDRNSQITKSEKSIRADSSRREKIKTLGKDDLVVNDSDDDIMPGVAMEMGLEAQMRFLKAKLRVTQEEVNRVNGELAGVEEELKQARSRVKELEEENSKLQKKAGSQLSQVDRYKKVAEDAKVKVQELEVQVQTQKREIETMKREQKQQVQTHNATEVRLNRATEEVDRLKSELTRCRSGSNSAAGSNTDRHRVEELAAENKKLERQRGELMAAFKKQLRLIDVLKRQRLHLEAARLLQFTEEEFLRALDRGAERAGS